MMIWGRVVHSKGWLRRVVYDDASYKRIHQYRHSLPIYSVDNLSDRKSENRIEEIFV